MRTVCAIRQEAHDVHRYDISMTGRKIRKSVREKVVRSSDFKRWRKSLELSQKQAAEALGLKRRMVQYYEKGERDGEKVAVPKSIRLACWALSAGVEDYHGPDIVADPVRSPPAGTDNQDAPGHDSPDPGGSERPW